MRAIVLAFLTLGLAHANDFVLVKGGTLRPGIRVDDFEMLDHPVTNAEYKLFVDDAKYPAPQHWQNGRAPSGMENWPVVFVNRYHDAAAYVKWRTAKEGRVCRLPTWSEFEYAARAGKADAAYPWGNEAPAGRANYDATAGRTLGQWRQHLKPVKSYPRQNGAAKQLTLRRLADRPTRRPSACNSRSRHRVPASEARGRRYGVPSG